MGCKAKVQIRGWDEIINSVEDHCHAAAKDNAELLKAAMNIKQRAVDTRVSTSHVVCESANALRPEVAARLPSVSLLHWQARRVRKKAGMPMTNPNPRISHMNF